ncbi:MAG: UDP-glucose 4-epimerase GalE [Pseudomonadota bacterium]
MAKRIIVAGGAGYIGAHVCVELLNAGAEILVIDNFDNSSPTALSRVEKITGKTPQLLKADLAAPGDAARINAAVRDFKPTGGIHLAGLKAVGDSVAEPLRYFETNLKAAWTLIHALSDADAKTLVFSSSATVYGALNANPVNETGALGPTNPYGRTKFFIEEMLKDLARADHTWRICNLRYFNPAGAHPSGLIGEDPNGVPNNLFPFIAQVAVGRRKEVSIFGDDYPTSDGTGVRDYIHVSDLARGHMAALDYLENHKDGGEARDVNLGCGKGVSVLEAIDAFKRASNRDIPYTIAPRRPGDIAEIVADPSKAADLFGWRTEKTLDNMCADHWRWQRENPDGYPDD